jgi:hypothetical protein
MLVLVYEKPVVRSISEFIAMKASDTKVLVPEITGSLARWNLQ